MRRVEPADSVRGTIAVPGDKSISHRALLLAAVAEGQSRISSFGRSADTESTIAAVRALGVRVDEDDTELVVVGAGLNGLREPAAPLDCRNAGTLMRLLCGLVAGQTGGFVLTGDGSLGRRPMERVAGPLRAMGAEIDTTDGHAPVTVRGGRLRPIRYELPVASAQVKSAILLAGLLADSGPTCVIEPAATRDHTERLLRTLGVRVQRRGREVRIWPVESLQPFSIEVPGDFSSAAPFVVAATLLPGSKLRILDVNVNPTRTGLLQVLGRMGAQISVLNERTVAGESVAELEIVHAGLTATEVEPAEVPMLIDELPLFALAASMARGESVVRGARELRKKESDRIETVSSALCALGVHIRELADGFKVRGSLFRLRGGIVGTSGDHRLAMLGGVAGLVGGEGVGIQGANAVATSFPGFFDLLESIKGRVSQGLPR
jgi:3-phosphoshikimate 1-carboxyvinyltransferase